MKKIFLGALLVVSLASCSSAPSGQTESSRTVSQPLQLSAPGWITAFGGSGVRGSSPSGASALSANLDSPSGLALCPDGALYVSDTGNNRILKFVGGTMSVVVSGQTAAGGKTYGNLLLNPRAESVIVTNGQIPGWTVLSPPGGWAEVPWIATRPEPLDGEMFFRANPAANGELYQDVDVSAYVTAIAASAQQFVFSGFVHSLSGDTSPDAAEIVVEYRTGPGGTILSTYDSGPQQNRGEWQLLTDTRLAPTATRSIRVRLVSTRHTGTGNDAYYDGLFLRALPSATIGDGGPAINATLALPHGLACDSAGQLYIADTYNNRIRLVSSAGMISTIAGRGTFGNTTGGSGVATSMSLSLPMSVSLNSGAQSGLAFDFVFSDFLAHRVLTYSSGVVATILSGNGGPCPLIGGPPSSVPVNQSTCVYYPMGVDTMGNVLSPPHITVADRSDNAVLNTDTNHPAGLGISQQITNGPGFSDAVNPPWWAASSPFGTTYRPVAVTSVNASPSNTPLSSGLVRGYLNWPSQIQERVPGFFVADLSNHAVRHGTVEGVLQTVAGNGTPGDSGDGGPSVAALFTAPSALAESRDGTLYVADAETNRIRKISCADVDNCSYNAQFDAAGTCTLATVTPAINDGNRCTVDSCYWTVGVDHQAYPASAGVQHCDDGNVCNGSEVCSGTTCVAGAPLTAGTACPDGNKCNGDEVCDANHLCQPGSLPVLDDSLPCTVDSCDPAGGVTHTALNAGSCTVRDLCQTAGTCSNGVCVTTAVKLTTTNPCVTLSCDSSKGVIQTAVAGSCPGGTCSSGVCVPSGGITEASFDNTVPPTSAGMFASIYGTGGVQTGASAGTGPGQLNPAHAAHLYGAVADSTGAGLAGVTVVILNHPESGQTLTRASGKFDIVANGGGPLVVRFTLSGYLPVDRTANPVWGGGAHIADVVMLPVDSTSTSVAVNSASFQDAAGTAITAAMDARGQRQVRVAFPANTSATSVDLAGTTKLLPAMTVRATEFTVGTSAQAVARMPAPLPGSSLYTYAVDFSVDEAPSAASVTFNQPVFSYLDNFLKMPTGATVPDGYYDRNKTAWVAEDNGIVMAIVGYSSGSAVVDVTGDGVENSSDTTVWNAMPANERLTAGERVLLATRYPGATQAAPKSLWRVPLTHFSMHDFNWGGAPACDNSTPPNCPGFNGVISGGADAPQAGSCEKQGSIIGAEEQSLGESLPVIGTPYTLEYRSNFTLGYLPTHGAEVDFPPTPGLLTANRYEVSMDTPSGFFKIINPAVATNYISWDGLDGSGQRVNGSQLATFGATAVYTANYGATGHFGDAAESDTISGGYTTDPSIAPEVRFTRRFTKVVSAWGADTLGFGGWMLSPMHVYDSTAGVLYQGDGHRRNLHNEASIRRVAGDGTATKSIGPATATGIEYSGQSDQPGLAVASTGDVYFWSYQTGGASVVIRKIDALTQAVSDVVDLGKDANNSPYRGGRMAFSPDGKSLYIAASTVILQLNIAASTFQVFAGTGADASGNSGHVDGPANQAQFNGAFGIAVAADGTLYVGDNGLIRRIGTDNAHTVTTVAGSSSSTADCSNGANGKPAKTISLSKNLGYNSPVVAADGSLWIGGGPQLVRVDPSGVAWCYSTGTNIGGLAIGADQTVYFASFDDDSIRRVNPDGTSTVIAGGSTKNGAGEPTDGAQAANTAIGTVSSLAQGPDGSVYFINRSAPGNPGRIYEIGMPINNGGSSCPTALPSEDGSQTFCFDANGRHLSTRSTLTGATLLTFTYTNNLLSSIVDADQNTTTITPGSGSTPVMIKGPFGETTKIGLDPTTNYATYIQDANQNQTVVSHDAHGLLLSLKDSNAQLHTFSYDSLGRLEMDSDPAGGRQTLSRPVQPAASYTVSDVTAMGAASTYAVSVDAQNNETRTVTLPDGSANVSTLNASGATVTSLADGRTVTETTAPDKIWPSYLPYVTSTVTKLPSGNTSTVSVPTGMPAVSYQAGVTPPLIDTLTEQFVNAAASSNPLTRVYKNATQTYTVTTPNGRVGTESVDVFGRPLNLAPIGSVDSNGVAITGGVAAIAYAYDHGRLYSMIQGARQTTFDYYPTTGTTPGLLKRITVADGTSSVSTTVVPNNDGQPLSSTTGYTTATPTTPRETDFSWDGEGNLKTVTPPSDKTPAPFHVQSYTPVNLLSTYTPPSVTDVPNPQTSFFYNVDRGLEYVRQPGGRGIDYVYTPSTGQLVNILADGANSAAFTYYPSPSNASGATAGRLQTATRGSTTVTLKYDGPLTTSQAWSGTGIDAVNGRVSWGYDGAFRLQSETVAPAPTVTGMDTVTYGYDPDSLPTCVSLSGCSAASGNRMTLTYDPSTGQLTGSSLGLITEAYTYNAYGELATHIASRNAGVQFSSETYEDGTAANARDGFGRLRHENTRDYQYDEQGHIWKVSVSGTLTRQYGYDAHGNRTSIDTAGDVIATYDDQDRMLTYNGASYAYGPNGERKRRNRSDGSVDEYQYDAVGNLTHVTRNDGVTFDYVVDAMNRRIAKKQNGVTVAQYIYRNGLSPVAVLDGSGNLLSRFVYATRANTPDFMVLSDGSVYKFINDERGTPHILINVATHLATSIQYDEFGSIAFTVTNRFAPNVQPFGFAGGLYDPDTGLVRFGARDYEPETGRWLAKDPALFGGRQTNLYVYAGNDPVNWRDPTGLYWIDAKGARNWDESETQAILADQIAEFADHTRFSICGTAFNEGGGYGGRFDFKFSPFFADDYFWIPGVGRVNAATFGNYFAGYVYQTALKGNALPNAGLDLALWGGRLTHWGPGDDSNSIEAINRGALDADNYFKSHPWPGDGG